MGLVAAACLVFSTFALAVMPFLVAARQPSCMMAPDRAEITLAHNGLVWLEGEKQTGACEEVPVEKWTRKRAGSVDLFVSADGPSGSGRYWTITFGTGEADSPRPERGTCLAASTLGWRTLQQFKNSPLVWLDDLDGDGKAELILWNSFPLREEATMAEFGLMGWVYRLKSKDSLAVDWNLSRQMAREIAAAYRTPLKVAPPHLGPLRDKAAGELGLFADKGCKLHEENGREPSW